MSGGGRVDGNLGLGLAPEHDAVDHRFRLPACNVAERDDDLIECGVRALAENVGDVGVGVGGGDAEVEFAFCVTDKLG